MLKQTDSDILEGTTISRGAGDKRGTKQTDRLEELGRSIGRTDMKNACAVDLGPTKRRIVPNLM